MLEYAEYGSILVNIAANTNDMSQPYIPYYVCPYIGYTTVGESLLSRWMSELLQAVQHIHKLCIIHRDIKIENILITSHGQLKLADFGCSEKISDTGEGCSASMSIGGTWLYYSPELCDESKENKVHDMYKADVWACGLVCYICIYGYAPYYSDIPTDLFDAIVHSSSLPTWPHPPPFNATYNNNSDSSSNRKRTGSSVRCSPQLTAFMRDILHKDPGSRSSAESLLSHLFIANRHRPSVYLSHSANATDTSLPSNENSDNDQQCIEGKHSSPTGAMTSLSVTIRQHLSSWAHRAKVSADNKRNRLGQNYDPTSVLTTVQDKLTQDGKLSNTESAAEVSLSRSDTPPSPESLVGRLLRYAFK